VTGYHDQPAAERGERDSIEDVQESAATSDGHHRGPVGGPCAGWNRAGWKIPGSNVAAGAPARVGRAGHVPRLPLR
jgi:hypothetical protein